MASNYLGMVIGWYLLVFGLLLLFRHTQMQDVFNDVLKSRALFFTIALFTFIIGLLLLIAHHFWSSDWTVAITIIGWILVITAAARLFFAESIMKSGKEMVKKSGFIRGIGVFFVIVGVYLLLNVYHWMM